MKALLLALAISGRFAEDCSDCWPGWTVLQDPASGKQISVHNGSGQVTVHGISTQANDNQQHLALANSEGATRAVAELGFVGSQNTPGWARLFSSGSETGIGYCEWLTAPWVPADLGWTLTLYDSGASWVGAFVGAPDAYQISRWPRIPPPQEFTTLALLQAHQGQIRQLSVVTMLPVIQWGERFTVDLSVNNGEAAVVVRYGGSRYSAQAPLRFRPELGLVGLIARTAPRSMCSGSGFLRDFSAYRVEAQ